MRVVTFGSRKHPLMRAALEVVRERAEVDRVGHVETRDERPFMCDPKGPAFASFLTASKPDLLLSAGYGRILPEAVLAIPSIGSINIHPALLPEYRGSNALSWALYEGRSEAGVTIHEMTPPVDAGPILAQGAFPLNPTDTIPILYAQAAELAAALLRRVMDEILAEGTILGRPQEGQGSYRGPAWKEYDRLVPDWSLPAGELVRRARVFEGYMNIPLRRHRIIIARMVECGATDARSGTTIRRRPRAWDVAAGDGHAVRLYLHQPLRTWLKLCEDRVRPGSPDHRAVAGQPPLRDPRSTDQAAST